jgi:hypothetical protein
MPLYAQDITDNRSLQQRNPSPGKHEGEVESADTGWRVPSESTVRRAEYELKDSNETRNTNTSRTTGKSPRSVKPLDSLPINPSAGKKQHALEAERSRRGEEAALARLSCASPSDWLPTKTSNHD